MLKMKVKYLGKSNKLENGVWYDIEYSITPRYTWVMINGTDIQFSYSGIGEFIKEWGVLEEFADFCEIMRKLP